MLPGGIFRRKVAVEVIEAGAARQHKLPGLDPGGDHRVAVLVSVGEIGGFVQLDGLFQLIDAVQGGKAADLADDDTVILADVQPDSGVLGKRK